MTEREPKPDKAKLESWNSMIVLAQAEDNGEIIKKPFSLITNLSILNAATKVLPGLANAERLSHQQENIK